MKHYVLRELTHKKAPFICLRTKDFFEAITYLAHTEKPVELFEKDTRTQEPAKLLAFTKETIYDD